MKNKLSYGALLEKYKGKRVLVTGNTGFKGSWLTHILLECGAYVIGYALKPATKPNLFTIAGLEEDTGLHQIYGDVRDLELVKKIFSEYKPEIVIHLAAQPIVRDSYRDPVNTYSTNVMGTVNVCECVRLSAIPVSEGGLKSDDWKGVISFLNVTTDKVYKNFEWEYGYREDDPLDGYDPYSNSKSCSELVTHSYKNSFYAATSIRVSTARAGNVIGGGDFSKDRIIPDCIRAVEAAYSNNKNYAEVVVRNPYSTRPYQHVIEPLFAYLTIAMAQYKDAFCSGFYNVGPDDMDCMTTGDLVELLCRKWNLYTGFPRISWKNVAEKDSPHEANLLKLDCSRLKSRFGWTPRWYIEKAIEETVAFHVVWLSDGDIKEEMNREIREYVGDEDNCCY